MGFMDMLTGKNADKDLFGDEKGDKESEGSLASVQELYGLPANAPAGQPQQVDPAGQPQAAAPQAPAPAAPAPAPTTPAPAPVEASTPAAPTPAPAEADGAAPVEDPLASGLRDLFTENSAMDPQLEALLKRVDKVSAIEISTELKEFARSVGVPGTEGQPQS